MGNILRNNSLFLRILQAMVLRLWKIEFPQGGTEGTLHMASSRLSNVTGVLWCQAEAPEEDMDVRGGGAAADDARIVKPGYESDDEEEPRRWPGHHTSATPAHLVRSLHLLDCCC